MKFSPFLLLMLWHAAPSGAQEIRGFWADGFADGFKTPLQIDTLLERLRRANCNAVFAQMRKSADARYQSRYDVWSMDNPERFDALAYLIEKAHSGRPRIQVHAWLNALAVGKDRGNPYHVTVTHPDWLSSSSRGSLHDGEATKLDPGHPDAADYTARVYLDVLRRYDVDGIHFDFIRYGGPEWGYNPASVLRFNSRFARSGQPAPGDPLWTQWRRDQVTAIVRKVYAMTGAVSPRAQVTAATITWLQGPRNLAEWQGKSAAMTRVFQDWRSWMKEGILDLNCMMSYYDERRHPDWYRLWLDWAKDNQFRRYAAPAVGTWLNLIPNSFSQIAAVRKPSPRGYRSRGLMLYSYAGTNRGPDGAEQRFNEDFYTALSSPSVYSQNPPFNAPADYPKIPWKERPRNGHLMGFVFEGSRLDPVDSTRVLIEGRGIRKLIRTDGTGFFAAIELAPGRYSVRLPDRRTPPEQADVGPGTSSSVTFTRTGSGGPSAVVSELSELARIGPFSPVTVKGAVVIGGSDTIPGALIVTDTRRKQLVRVQLSEAPVLPFQPGDVVALRGHWDPSSGESVIDNAVARFTGVMPDATPATFLGRVDGRVIDDGPNKIRLSDGRTLSVALGSRKMPGIEEPVSSLSLPPPQSSVRVRGIVSGNTIYPLLPGDVEVLRSAAENLLIKLLVWIAVAAAAAALTYFLMRFWASRRHP